MKPRAWNWRLWVGFVIGLIAPAGYFSLFDITRIAFWISILLFLIAIALLVRGLQRAFGQPESYRGKVAGPILALLTLVVIGLFSWGSLKMKDAYAAGHHAPRVGDKAPQFTLADDAGRQVTLAELLSSPISTSSGVIRAPHGVLLVFYRGYW